MLEQLKETNKRYHHYSYIAEPTSFDAFHSSGVDLFAPDADKKKSLRFKFTAKDVFNTNIYPTEMGSEQWKGFKAGNNARVITDCLWSGDACYAKATCSEFAVHAETLVVNPWNLEHSVGTSSSGSAVSVLVDDIDYSLATQTAGSIGRPASFTGVMGMKPTYGLVPRTGVLKTCDPFDTVGCFIKDERNLSEIMRPLFKVGPDHPTSVSEMRQVNGNKKLKLASFGHPKVKYSEQVQQKYGHTLAQLDGDIFDVVDYDAPDFLSDIHSFHDIVYSYSLAYYFKSELQSLDAVSQSFVDTVRMGQEVDSDEFVKLLNLHQEHIKAFETWMNENQIDYIFVPSTTDTAPSKTNCYEISDDLSLIWTYLHVPVVYLPIWFDDNTQLPFGASLVGRRFDDLRLMDVAQSFMARFPKNQGNTLP